MGESLSPARCAVRARDPTDGIRDDEQALTGYSLSTFKDNEGPLRSSPLRPFEGKRL
jgi:hypothetical protein